MSDWQGSAKPTPPPTKSELREATKQYHGKRARDRILALFVGGILLSVIGVVMAISEQPSSTPMPFGPPLKSGSDGWYGLGLILVGVGYTMMLVAVIAWGVMLGNRASQD